MFLHLQKLKIKHGHAIIYFVDVIFKYFCNKMLLAYSYC